MQRVITLLTAACAALLPAAVVGGALAQSLLPRHQRGLKRADHHCGALSANQHRYIARPAGGVRLHGHHFVLGRVPARAPRQAAHHHAGVVHNS
jgi:hypothetical protein